MSKQSLGRVAMVPKGAYSATTAYERLDVVTHDGASYIVLRPVQGVTPADGEDYMLLVQDGDTPDLSIGTVETLEAGSEATASIGGTPDKPVLDLSIPKGDTGAAPVLKMGKVTTLEPGSEASASLSGTAEEPELNLNIPRGASGGVDVANAEVGQTIIVKAVDDNGKPTEWEAADMVSGGGYELVGEAETIEDVASISFDLSKPCTHLIVAAFNPNAVVFIKTEDGSAVKTYLNMRVNGSRKTIWVSGSMTYGDKANYLAACYFTLLPNGRAFAMSGNANSQGGYTQGMVFNPSEFTDVDTSGGVTNLAFIPSSDNTILASGLKIYVWGC